MKLAFVVSGLSLAAASAEATQVDPTSLRNAGWTAESEHAAPNTPCNYLYTDQAGNLLYYGTSATCATRLGAHFALTRSGYEMMAAAVGFTAAAQRAAFLKSMVDWAKETDSKGVSLNHGGSDNCLGVAQAQSQLQVWYVALPSGADAATVEAKVLANAVGYCNRQGAGTTRLSWAAFQQVLQKAGARP